jgi:CRP/FNR family transcriptional regulator
MNQPMGIRIEPARLHRVVGSSGPAPESGDLAALLTLMGAKPAEVHRGANIPTSVRRLREGESLFLEGGRAQAIYFVRAGTFKNYCTCEDGYEQVLGFTGRGELLGFDGIGGGVYENQAVALEESSVYVVLLRDFFGANPRNPELDRIVFGAVSASLKRRAELADVMAAVAAEVRLARFLMHLSQRMASCGLSPRRFHLRMSRRDIASYLGVAHETVSRSFSALAEGGLVRVDNREVEILDMAGLKTFSSGTRRGVEGRASGASPKATPADAMAA